jgi:hypothetical protein
MRPGLSGWTPMVTGQDHSPIIEYRMPLRKNWLIRINRAQQSSVVQSTLVQSRTGSIHIVRRQLERSRNQTLRTKSCNLVLASFGAAVSVSALRMVGTLDQPVPNQDESPKINTQSPLKDLAPTAECTDAEVVSTSNVANALIGLPSKLRILERSESIELGGYRLTSLIVECRTQKFQVKITEAKMNSTWKLMKTARLEN